MRIDPIRVGRVRIDPIRDRAVGLDRPDTASGWGGSTRRGGPSGGDRPDAGRTAADRPVASGVVRIDPMRAGLSRDRPVASGVLRIDPIRRRAGADRPDAGSSRCGSTRCGSRRCGCPGRFSRGGRCLFAGGGSEVDSATIGSRHFAASRSRRRVPAWSGSRRRARSSANAGVGAAAVGSPRKVSPKSPAVRLDLPEMSRRGRGSTGGGGCRVAAAIAILRASNTRLQVFGGRIFRPTGRRGNRVRIPDGPRHCDRKCPTRAAPLRRDGAHSRRSPGGRGERQGARRRGGGASVP